jgi:YVTN family beta-propeller protein
MSTLLSYSIDTNPQLLQASPATGSLLNGSITLAAINNTGGSVTIHGISIGIPTGAPANNLTDQPAAIYKNLPAGWIPDSPVSSAGLYTFMFSAPAGSATIENGESLSFSFSSIPLVREPGTPVIVITEGSAGGPQDTPGIILYPNGFGTVLFSATPANINAGESIVLNWSGPSGATYTIQYTDANAGTVNIPGTGEPALGPTGTYPGPSDAPLTLTETTIFTLTVAQTVNGTPFVLSTRQTVMVGVASPILIEYTGTMQQDGSLLLSWTTQDAASVEIPAATSATLPASGTFTVNSPSFPLVGNYALTAYNASWQQCGPYPFSGYTGQLSGPVASIPVGNNPVAIAITPDGSQAVVLNQTDNTVSVIDLATHPPAIAVNPIPVGNGAFAIAITPDGSQAVVINQADNTVSVINLATNPPTISGSPVAVGNNPVAIAITPNGSQALVLNQADNTVSVIDLATNPPTISGSPVAVGNNPVGIAITPDGSRALVINQNDGTLSIINLATNPPAISGSSIPVGLLPTGIAITPDGLRALVANDFGTICVLDLTTNPPTIAGNPLTVPNNNLLAIPITPDGSRALVIGINGISVIDLTTTPPAIYGSPVSYSDGLTAFAITPDSLRALFIFGNDDTVSIIDLTTNPPNIAGNPVTLGNHPVAIAITPDGSRVLAANSGDNTVSVFAQIATAGFDSVFFNATPAHISEGQTVVLNWIGPSAATYSIQYLDAGNNVVNIPGAGDPALGSIGAWPGPSDPPLLLTQTTVFTLTVTQTINNVPVTLTSRQTVTVAIPPPVIISFTATPGSILYNDSGTPATVTLAWTGANISSLILAGQTFTGAEATNGSTVLTITGSTWLTATAYSMPGSGYPPATQRIFIPQIRTLTGYSSGGNFQMFTDATHCLLNVVQHIPPCGPPPNHSILPTPQPASIDINFASGILCAPSAVVNGNLTLAELANPQYGPPSGSPICTLNGVVECPNRILNFQAINPGTTWQIQYNDGTRGVFWIENFSAESVTIGWYPVPQPSNPA